MLLPAEFKEMLRRVGGPVASLADELAAAEIPAAVRLNASKPAPAPAGATPVPWCEGGYFLPDRPRFTLDPAFHQGLYYVQDSSSMAHRAAVARAASLAAVADPRYLDACAAPGGKTVAAADVLGPDAFIVANEFDPRRAAVLRENVAKHGSGRVAVVRADAAAIDLPTSFFDIIAADVPCSGEGMMVKEAAAVEQWSPALVRQCAALQRRIVDNLWDALAPGGFFIYSTCTFNIDENELIVDHIINDLGAEAVDIPELERPEIANAAGGHTFAAYRFLPGRVPGHGQFIALLRKNGDGGHCRVKPAREERVKADISPDSFLEGDWTLTRQGDSLAAVPSGHTALLGAIARCSGGIQMAGIELGTVKGRDFIPSQSLAMAAALRPDAFARVEIGHDDALDYLRRNPLRLPDGSPRGIVLLTRGGHPLGFVKNLGNRANNLYPAPWRILH